MITIKNQKEMKEYYDEKVNTYVFKDNVEFLCEVNVEAHIKANDIRALNIKACDINANNINAHNIIAVNINAQNIDAFDICAHNIKALNIYANDINAYKIRARNIDAYDITAKNISYFAVCFAYHNIECNSIKGRHTNAKHFVLKGETNIKEE